MWQTFQFCGEISCGEPSLWRTFMIPVILVKTLSIYLHEAHIKMMLLKCLKKLSIAP